MSNQGNDNPRFTYYRMHIPSKEIHTVPTTEYFSIRDLLAAINGWNSKQPGVWQYWV